MRREDFEHVIAAAAEVSGEREIVVIGSQAILGSVVDPPKTMLFSMEADIYPLHDPAKADAIDGSLGDGSRLGFCPGSARSRVAAAGKRRAVSRTAVEVLQTSQIAKKLAGYRPPLRRRGPFASLRRRAVCLLHERG